MQKHVRTFELHKNAGKLIVLMCHNFRTIMMKNVDNLIELPYPPTNRSEALRER